MDLSPTQGILTMVDLEQASNPTHQSIMDIEKVKGPIALLYALPTELRFMILGDCIASGHPEFMRASRALQKDGQAIICKEGVYRMRFGAGIDDKGQRPSQEVANAIQNIEITIDLMKIDWTKIILDLANATPANPVLGRSLTFAGSQILRGHCEVVVQIKCALDVELTCEVMGHLSLFERFKEMSLRMERHRTEGLGLPLCTCTPKGEETAVEEMMVYLASRLGKAKLVKVENGWRMTFYPRKHAEEIAGGVEG